MYLDLHKHFIISKYLAVLYVYTSMFIHRLFVKVEPFKTSCSVMYNRCVYIFLEFVITFLLFPKIANYLHTHIYISMHLPMYLLHTKFSAIVSVTIYSRSHKYSSNFNVLSMSDLKLTTPLIIVMHISVKCLVNAWTRA